MYRAVCELSVEQADCLHWPNPTITAPSAGTARIASVTIQMRIATASAAFDCFCGRILLGRRWIDVRANARNHVSRKPGILGVLANEVFAGRPVDTVDLVRRDVALDPLNVRAEFAQNSAGRLRCRLQLGSVKRA